MTVIVGVDGSPGSRAAAEYALEEAALRNAELVFVTVVMMPEHWASGMLATQPSPEVVEGVRAEIVALINEVRAAHPAAAEKVSCSSAVRIGEVGPQMVEAAKDAEVLVVGHRGRGRLASAVLGSVGLYCVLHATCTVTVVR